MRGRGRVGVKGMAGREGWEEGGYWGGVGREL